MSIPTLALATGDDALLNFSYWVAASRKLRGEVLDFSQRSRFLGFAVEKNDFDRKLHRKPPRLSDYGEYLLELMATSRADLIEPTREIAMGVVTSGRFVPSSPESTGYFGSPAKLSVFALEMLAVMRGEVIDWESFHIPPDRFWLDCARIGLPEPDPVKAAEWGGQLCDAHMATLQADKDNPDMSWFQGFEMVNEAHHLWPISVYAFIRARARLGLATAEIDHPLMRTSFAILKDWTVPAGSWQAQPWFTEIIDRIQQIEPALEPALDLVRNG
ncbi:hypothetical protein FNJ84_21215 [Paracoccus sp. M683]|uniref:hypothetical protein n=1 Tax=Paracoccus sp. M683 TaxID=2594268 RepID=UPI00117E59C5|nr:hypothetical protein [Paracoccus sp. M683]TRW92127.1 hypothetical protein FNJ84_21215 [Paracoccus sp. M683]